jgi:hypothetical protein
LAVQYWPNLEPSPKIKPFLPDVALHKKFSPEIARRLGDHFFTKDFTISKYTLNQFVEAPLDMLCEVIETMDAPNRSALALVFIRGGTLPSPHDITDKEEQAISRIGGTLADTIKSLKSLDGSLLRDTIKDSNHYWQFKHPTIRDAFAKIVVSNRELMDIYLTGAPLDKLFSEISCGDVGLQGVSVIVPAVKYPIIINKIKRLDITKWNNRNSLHRFLSKRCAKDFLTLFLKEFPRFISTLSVSSYIFLNPIIDILIRLNEAGLLPEKYRLNAISSIKSLAIDKPDSGFLRDDVKSLMSDDELSDILKNVQYNLLPNLESVIYDWQNDYDESEEPEAYFEDLISSLNDYKREFKKDETSCRQIEDAQFDIEQIIEELKLDYNPEPDVFLGKRSSSNVSQNINSRSIYDDVDC